ncbi:WD40 repeat-like protein [Pleurotus eryngii]|uniref:WD40 repeat-like protein n=1 Tax=Pleurotus eryngii TaxID=5323 RepID=A0A9P6A5W1_PLEER|nr:WD40 repeat-like protein [Pleurotus eryngii]
MHESELPTLWPFSYERCLRLPGQVTCLNLGGGGQIYAGSSDGSVRVYDSTSLKVLKAIQGLGDEVASIVCCPKPDQVLDNIFISVGCRIMSFGFPPESPKLIQKQSDALMSNNVGEDDDVLNELSLSDNKDRLAFCCDSGNVGVVDLASKVVSTMKAKHSSICGCVKFIPNRPSELFSAGYDHALYHFDFSQRKLLSVYNIPLSAAASGMSLSPPFVMSTAISSTGIFAAGTADGRLLLGYGGEKCSANARNKRSKKWNGLKTDYIIELKLAEGPIVAVTFVEDSHPLVCTLMGSITRMAIQRDDKGGVKLETEWTIQAKDIEKVNSLVIVPDGTRIILGGLDKKGGGIIEIWNNTTVV